MQRAVLGQATPADAMNDAVKQASQLLKQ
jgi:hypothetical protein